MAWRTFLLVAVVLALAVPAGAFQCPEPNQLVQQGGQWTAPGGWRQSDYAPPTPGAKIWVQGGLADAFYNYPSLMCTYQVVNQPGVVYTTIRSNNAPNVDTTNAQQCAQRLPGYYGCPTPQPFMGVDCSNPSPYACRVVD